MHDSGGRNVANNDLPGKGWAGVFKLANWVERTTNDVVSLHGPRTKEEE